MIIEKSSGEKVAFSLDKWRSSPRHSGATEKDVQHILDIVRDELYQGILPAKFTIRLTNYSKRKKLAHTYSST
jgi:hypothetical protein